MFAQAREAAGLSRLEVDGATVGQVLDLASADLGTHFAAVWVNGEPADRDVAVAAADEVAVLPPVSGGAA